MKNTLRLAMLGGILLQPWSPPLFAEPVLFPQANERKPAEQSQDAVYVIRREPISADEGASPANDAVEGRHRALEQFRLGDQAFKQGRTQEAAQYYAPLRDNPHLTPQERLMVTRLCEQLERKDTRRSSALQGVRTDTQANAKDDADQVLADARQAFAMRDYDRAEQLALVSQQLGHRALLPWSDSPARLLQEVKAARQQPVPVARPAKPGPLLLAQAPQSQDKGRPVPQVEQMPPLLKQAEPPRGSPADARTPRTESDPLAQRASSARALLEQAHLYVQAGDFNRARQLLKDAEAQRANIPWWEDFTPEKVRLEITRAELAAKARPQEQPGVTQGPPIERVATESPIRPSRAPAPPRPVRHEPLVADRPIERPSVVTMPEPESPGVVQASAVISDPPVERRGNNTTSKPNRPGSTWPPPGPNAKALVAEARKQLQAGQLDTAVDIAKQAQLVPGMRWGHFEDSPERVLNDVARARQDHQEKRAADLLADARRLLIQGRLDEAERLTYQAEALRPEYPALYRGEKHDRLRAEIAEKRRALAKTQLPPAPEPVKAVADSAKKPAIPKDTEKVAAKSRPVIESPWLLLEPRKPESEIIARSQPLAHGGAGNHTKAGARGELPTPAEVIARSEARRVPSTIALPKVDSSTRPEARPSPVKRPEPDPAGTESFKPLPPSPDLNIGANKPTEERTPVARPSDMPASSPSDQVAGKKASEYLAEARQHQLEGLLLEALAAWQFAKGCHAAGGAEDDISDELLQKLNVELHHDAKGQVAAFASAVHTLTTRGHYRDAERYLKYMQTLQSTFQIEQTASSGELKASADQRPSSFQGVPTTFTAEKADSQVVQASTMPPERGPSLLEDARRELQLGNHSRARRFAEAAYAGPPVVRTQAKDLLAAIDDAEFRDGARKAQVQYELGAHAFASRDYHGAGLYLHGLDTRLLNEQARDHVREMLASKEMLQRTQAVGVSPVNVTVIVNTPGADPVIVTPDIARRPALPAATRK